MINDPNNPVLKNPDVDQCYGIHLNNSKEVGTISVTDGAMTANSDRFSINISGKGGHAMAPH
jgi:amidohydrolase